MSRKRRPAYYNNVVNEPKNIAVHHKEAKVEPIQQKLNFPSKQIFPKIGTFIGLALLCLIICGINKYLEIRSSEAANKQKELELAEQKLQNDYEYKKIQEDHKTKVEMEKLQHKKIFKDREFNLEKERLEVAERGKLIDAQKEIVLKSLENPKKKKISFLFGLFSSEEDVSNFPEPNLGLTMEYKSEGMKNNNYVHSKNITSGHTGSTIDEL